MEWKLFANLAETAGASELSVDADGETIGDALDALLDTHPELREEVVTEDGELRDHVRLLHDGEDPFVRGEGFDTEVTPGDELALFPPVSGG